MAGGRSSQRFANDQSFEVGVKTREPGRPGLSPDLVTAGAELTKGFVSGNAYKLIARMRALVDLSPLEAIDVAALSRHASDIQYPALSR